MGYRPTDRERSIWMGPADAERAWGVEWASPRPARRGSAKRGRWMIGEQIGESKGRRLVRRVTSTDPTTVEVTFEDSGHMLGVATTGLGTYTSVIGLDGSIFGEGQGVSMTQDGEAVTWKGTIQANH